MRSFVILSVCTLTVVFGLGVVASTVTPPAVEKPQAEQKI